MVRFKVIKASHLLLGIAAVILAIVVIGIILNLVFFSEPQARATQANFVQMEYQQKSEAETKSVFASLSENTSLSLDPQQDNALQIEIISEDKPSPVELPSILIYHTHTHEAYEQIETDRYDAIETWRTTDQDYSIVRVGQELADLLRNYGFFVVHDTTDHEQDDLKTAYTRSLETLSSYEEKFDLYIDLHRDAYVDGTQKRVITDNGDRLAQIMILIGNGEGFDEKPFYEENLAFAEALTERINKAQPGLCKDVLVKDGRYNQHIGLFGVLIEVGHNRNTLKEAMASLPSLAQGIKSLLITDPEPELQQMAANHSSEM